MAWTDRLLNTLWGRGTNHEQIAEEQLFHVAERTRENITRGMTPVDARQDAELRFGNRTLLREETHDADVLQWAAALLRDIRIAVRGLSRRKGLAATVILSLAIGIGANSAIFSVVDAVLVKPLELPHPDRLIAINEARNGHSTNGNPQRLADWSKQVPGLAAAAGFYSEGVILTGEGDPVRLEGIATVGSILDVLGIQPNPGRNFTATELRSEGQRVVLLSERAWRTRFAADPKMIGRALRLKGESYVVIGIMPAGVGYFDTFDVLAPAPPDVQNASRKAGFLKLIARMKPGALEDAVQAQLNTVALHLARQYPDSDKGIGARLAGLQQDRVGESRLPLLILLGAVLLVLCIACVNIGTLLLTRAAERQRESAIRVSLGAGTGSLVRLYLVESVLLALAGGAAGLLLASAILTTLIQLLPQDTPRLAGVHLDLRVIGFAIALSLLCGFLFGVGPAWQAARNARIRDGVRSTASTRSVWTRRMLVAAQVTLSVVLLFGVGLLAKSFLLMRSAPLGFQQPSSLLTVKVYFSWETPQAKLNTFYSQAMDKFSAIPGVRSVGVADRLPLDGGSQSGPITIQGRTLSPELEQKPVSRRAASAGYFSAIGTPLKQGRFLHERATQQGPREAVINETLAHEYFPQGDAIGQRVALDSKSDKPVWFEIVGITGDVRQTAAQTQAPADVFILPRDTYWPYANFVLRAEGDPRSLIAAVRDAVREIDPNQPIREIATMQDLIDASSADVRVRVWLLSAFAGIALLLAAIGLYGVLASDVAQRKREIGVRLALGAEPNQLLRNIVRRGLAVTLIGLAAGLCGAIALSRFLATLLFGVAPLDTTVLIGVAIVMMTVAVIASWIPGRRAARVDPMLALRHE